MSSTAPIAVTRGSGSHRARCSASRWAFVRVTASDVVLDLSLLGGFGKYYLRETFVDKGLSPMVYKEYASSLGGFGAIEASVKVAAFRAVIGYGYHAASAEADDRIRGAVYAGGHEISIGIGAVL